MSFLDNLSDKFTNFTNSATQKVDAFLDNLAAGQVAFEAESKRELLFAELGRLSYYNGDRAKAGTRDADTILREINELTNQLDELNQQRAAREAEKAARQAKSEAKPAKRYCHHCGNAQQSDNKFCPKCGTELK